jgi:DNA-binding GntR family transcriptional regulator
MPPSRPLAADTVPSPAAPAPEPLSGVGEGPLGRRAYEAIFAAIQSGRLRPGSSVREAELTAWLGMSRTPLRDALQRLEREGLVRPAPYRGIVIAKLDRQETLELYLARERAEGVAAGLAARHATPAEVAALRHLLDLERAAADDPALGSRYNRRLHEAIYVAARNRYLGAHLRALAALLALVGDATRRDAARVAAALAEHTALVEAIAAGDEAAAEAGARRHIAAAQLFVLTNTDWDATDGRPA